MPSGEKLSRGIGRKGSFRYIISRERARRNLTLQDAVKLFKNPITPAYLSQIEIGDRIPSPKVCKSIAEAYGLDPTEMIRMAFMEKHKSFGITLSTSSGSTEEKNPLILYIMREIEMVPENKKSHVIKMIMDLISLSKI